MTGHDTDLQESMCPESRADLDHRALPTIQPANHTRDPQTGDISAVLHEEKVGKERGKTLDICESLMNIWWS